LYARCKCAVVCLARERIPRFRIHDRSLARLDDPGLSRSTQAQDFASAREVQDVYACGVWDELQGLLRRFASADGPVFVENEKKEFGSSDDVDRYGDILAHRLVVLGLEKT
jgi:hypothetical protein